MARGVDIKLDHSGMASLLKSGEIASFLNERAERVLAAAKADPHDDTGDYENGLHIDHATTDRAVARVVAGDWKSYILEAKYGILARALDAAGGE
jgi:hypothetical protein